MIKFIKQLFCKHESEYGELHGWCGINVWCKKCGKRMENYDRKKNKFRRNSTGLLLNNS